MCGVFAAFNYEQNKFSEADFIKATEMISHRGPDNLGHFKDGTCFMGNTRLSILGIGASGNQPFFFDNLVMVFNGEVFNYVELRDDLISLGYEFDSSSDTEVVIKAFHKWGGECFTKLNGMWALVIYDREKKRITASRDRFGQKPLFVMRQGNVTYFASEVQQLVCFSNGTIDYGLIQMFLKEGTYVANGRTFFREIEIFPKAHYCEIEANNICKSTCYWDYWHGEVRDVNDACFEEFSDLLKDAIRIRLRTDVPFGVLLSGGVDSTIVAAYAHQFHNSEHAIPAFTFASKDSDDETEYATSVARKLNLKLTVREQEQNPKDYRKRLKGLVKHMGRGHSSPAVVSVDYLFESVAQSGIKVVLDGQGSDELLAGYKNYFMLVIPMFLFKGQFAQAYRCFKDQINRGFFWVGILYLRNRMPQPIKRLMRLVYGYERFFKSYNETERSQLVDHHFHQKKNKNALNRYLIWQHNLGLENLLYYGDIVAMRNSVENRSPFMDHRLVDFVFSRSEKLKLWDAIDKYALRKLPIYKKFTAELDRNKIGFSSKIRLNTKIHMIEELRQSPILVWPIFTSSLRKFLDGSGFESYKYEYLLFRLYQVHLWNEIFNE